MPKRKLPKPAPQARRMRTQAAPKDINAATATTKTANILRLLSGPDGVTVNELAKAVRWQPHSVRGFLAGHVRKKLGLNLSSEKEADGVRRYRIVK